MKARSTLFLAALCLAPAMAHAYFEIDLASGGTILAESYVEEGDQLHVYRPAGELRVDRAKVREIREREGSLVSTQPKAKPAEEKPAVAAAPAEALPTDQEDLTKAELKLTREIILGHRNLLFARNGGAEEADLKERKKQLDAMEERRQDMRKQLGL